MVVTIGDAASKKCSFETALDLTGFGKYNIIMLITCCFTVLAMFMDIFGFSILMPPIACDISLDNAQQGLLSAVPLMGVMLSSYVWGLAADTIGRRKTLLIAMPIGFLFNIAASMAPGYTSLAILKFFSGTFTSSANAAAFVLLGESLPSKNRSRFMFIMSSITMSSQLLICLCAMPVYKLTFHYAISWLNMDYRPWRLLMQIISLPGAIGTLSLLILKESPKFLLSKGKNDEALAVLQNIFKWNTGLEKDDYPVTHVYLDDEIVAIEGGTSLLLKIWNQTAPLFKPPLLKNSIILYYLLLCAYMTSTGFSMWVPTMTNEFFMGEDTSGLSLCEVSSRSAVYHQTASRDCDHTIQPLTFYAVMVYSAIPTCLGILISFMVGPLGKKFTTLMVFAISILCGILLFFSKIPLLSIGLFFFFLYVCLILGNVNTYLVELNPTHLRGMATCLSVVVARGFAFISVQLIANLLANHCTAMMCGYIALNICFGKYNMIMLATCAFTVLAMFMDIFGFSILMPPIACDISLDNAQQGLLSAMPLLGVMLSSYVWGLAADTIGRRKTLLIAMPIGFLFNIAASMAPGYTSLAILKFFSGTFTSSANAAAFVLLGESVPSKNRSRLMFILVSATMSVQLLMCLLAMPVYKLTIHYEISWLKVSYGPWRLLMQIISLPAVFGILNLLILKESPKFLLSKGKNDEALAVLRNIFKWNTGLEKDDYPVTHVYLDDEIVAIEGGTSLLLKIWNQTAPLFKPPLLKNSIILYYLLLCAFMTATGFTMWVPTMTNEFFMGEDTSGRTFCEVSSRSAVNHQTASIDCNHTIQPLTFYAVMCYSAIVTGLGIVISFMVGPLGKKFTTLMVFAISILCGILLFFSKIPLLSIGLFFFFLYVSLILGNVNTYLVELNPTHLRGMATCLSVVVARGFAFISVQLIANLLANHCTAMMCGYIALNISGLLVATLLPPDAKRNRGQ